LGSLLEPFLHTLAHSDNDVVKDYIIKKAMIPLLDNNINIVDDDEIESDSEQKEDIKDIQKLIINKTKEQVNNQIEFNFPSFNILIFAQDYLFKYATEDGIPEEDSAKIYQLYEKALQLEPTPDKPELTFSQM
jgi:hypothetical protein